MDFKSDTYLKFLVLLEDSGQEIVFYKNVMSERWWMSIPDNGNSKNEHQNQVYYLPCSYADYTEAAEGNVPNRWIKAYNRINK
jgi:formiminoglutamase